MSPPGTDCIISVITPIHDGADKFPDTISSMPADSDALEWILVHDGTKPQEALTGGRSIPPYAKMITGDGQGATAAVNKGLSAATGGYCLFVMSDDLIVTDGIHALMKFLSANSECDVISANLDFFRDAAEPPVFRNKAAPDLTLAQILYGRPCLGGRLFKRELFDQYGMFDTAFTFCSDREFLGRLILAGASHTASNIPLYRYRVHSGSETMGGNKARIARYLTLHKKIAQGWLGRTGHSEKWRAEISRWDDYETARLAWYGLAQSDWRNAISVSARQFLRRPFWPVSAMIARKTARMIGDSDARLGP